MKKLYEKVAKLEIERIKKDFKEDYHILVKEMKKYDAEDLIIADNVAIFMNLKGRYYQKMFKLTPVQKYVLVEEVLGFKKVGRPKKKDDLWKVN